MLHFTAQYKIQENRFINFCQFSLSSISFVIKLFILAGRPLWLRWLQAFVSAFPPTESLPNRTMNQIWKENCKNENQICRIDFFVHFIIFHDLFFFLLHFTFVDQIVYFCSAHAHVPSHIDEETQDQHIEFIKRSTSHKDFHS